MTPVQVKLQGPTASLSSNYSSVFITCETVGATYLIFTLLTHRFGYMGHNPDILRHPLNTHNIGIFSLHQKTHTILAFFPCIKRGGLLMIFLELAKFYKWNTLSLQILSILEESWMLKNIIY